jgi:hypothetical protein
MPGKAEGDVSTPTHGRGNSNNWDSGPLSPSESSARRHDNLRAIRSLFFSLATHFPKLCQPQLKGFF